MGKVLKRSWKTRLELNKDPSIQRNERTQTTLEKRRLQKTAVAVVQKRGA